MACKYDKLWWIGVIEEINDEEQDRKVNFLHPPGPTKKFKNQKFIGIQQLITGYLN